jgi:hypothetical protein
MTSINDKALLLIANEIFEYALAEDRSIKKLNGKGIYFMSEIAFAYGVGKSIIRNAEKIFPGEKVEWIRELKVGEGGPCDLVFNLSSGSQIIIEFKMRDTAESYFQDIEKLKYKVEDRATRLFCALSNVFEKYLPADERIKLLEERYHSDIKRVGSLYNFPTWDVYKSPIHCVIGLWQIL